jgi:hypothetical protein
MHILDACISITWASGRGLGPGNLQFLVTAVVHYRKKRALRALYKPKNRIFLFNIGTIEVMDGT